MRFSALLLIILSSLVSAEGHTVNSVAPAGLENLALEVISHSASAKEGHHGLTEYCYKSNSYVVYSTSLLGHGYELSLEAPINLECIEPEFLVLAKNKIGMFIGMNKSEVESLIGILDLPKEKTIIWLSQVMHNGIAYDHQVYVQLKFNNGRLTWLSVFTTETS